MTNRYTKIEKRLENTSQIILDLASLIPEIDKTIDAITNSLIRGNKIVLFGNGGSAADAQHIAAEFIGRFNFNRSGLPALALTTNSSTLTSISNDYSYDVVFSRQCESLVKKGDVVIGISTSGNSLNVKKGLQVSKKLSATTIGLLGKKGSIEKIVDIALSVQCETTPEIQEAHRIIYHIICEHVEKNIMKKNKK
jgi:D-sedoheptulose 7-phosphate isomerase|tara:strand:+ start:12806 stop:13390 length:585 start_codon:yes stop_codon:yes gene_type:complete